MWIDVVFEHMVLIVSVTDALQRQRRAHPVVAVVADEGAALLTTVLPSEMSAQGQSRCGGQSDILLHGRIVSCLDIITRVPAAVQHSLACSLKSCSIS